MTRGRKPKPTKLKKLHGNPGKRALNDSEPQPAGRPECPAWLGDVAREEWERIANELERLGLLTMVDRGALAMYCEAWGRWRQAVEQLAGEPLTHMTESGYHYQNPVIGIARSAAADMLKAAAEFGMTPSARSRLRLDVGDGGEDDLEAFLNNARAIAVANAQEKADE